MCGILAISSNLPVTDSKVSIFKSALRLMEHRGPDFEDYMLVDNTVLGHRRLSIIDLTNAGNQPMLDKRNELIIIYNGEIYNYIEIRKELQSLGVRFTTNSDTEVILESYKQWGIQCLKKFNGMFAFIIYNKVTKEIFGARDRFGVKPLYYSLQKESIYFCSEIKPLLLLGAEVSLNTKYLGTYILESALDYEDGSLLQGISQIPAGHCFYYSQESRLSAVPWWTTDDYFINVPSSYNERVDLYKSLVEDAVSLRLRSDVLCSITLSGGMDSASIYSSIQYNLQKENFRLHERPKIFTIKYEEGSLINELDAVESLTNHFQDTFAKVNVTDKNIFHDLEKTYYFQEFPSWNLSPIAYHQVYKSIHSNGLKVLLEGHGNDEVLGGYHSHINLAVSSMIRQGNISQAYEASQLFSQMRNSGVDQSHIPAWIVFLYNAIPSLRSYRSSNEIQQYRTEGLWDTLIPIDYVATPKIERLSIFGNELMRLVTHSILPTVLRVFDRATMSSSIEMRAPFMDYRLIQFAFSSPDSDKIGGGYQKRILREAMKGILPEPIRTNKVKRAFSGNLTRWLNDRDNRDYISQNVFSTIHSGMPVNKTAILKKWSDLAGQELKWSESVKWSRIISYLVWHKLFIDGGYKNVRR